MNRFFLFNVARLLYLVHQFNISLAHFIRQKFFKKEKDTYLCPVRKTLNTNVLNLEIMKEKFFYTILFGVFLSLSISCSDDNEPPVIETNLVVDSTLVNVEAGNSTASLAILSNKNWTAKTEETWLKLSPSSGKANSKTSIEISVSENTETTERSGIITITADDKSQNVKVIQKGRVIVPGIEIKDENFKQYLIENFDVNEDGEISTEEAEAIRHINCAGQNISSLEGLENFVNLDTLNCNNNSLAKLNLNANTRLSALFCDSNKIDTLRLSNNTALKLLHCSSNEIANLDISNNTNLEELYCNSNELTNLDISKNKALEKLVCSDNDLKTLDVSENLALSTLNCTDNASLSKIMLSKDQVIENLSYDEAVTRLEYPDPEKKIIKIPDTNFKAYLVEDYDKDNDGEISEEEALAIKEIRCSRREIFSLEGISAFPNLEILVSNGNELRVVDVGENLKLKELECRGHNLGRIDVSKNPELTSLGVSSCGLLMLDVTNNKKLKSLNCSDNGFRTLDVSENILLENLYCQSNMLSTLDLRKNENLKVLNCRTNPDLTTVYLEERATLEAVYMDTPPTSFVYMSYVTVEDEAFMNYLVANFDLDDDGRLSALEAKEIKDINCSGQNISNLEGLEKFTNLTSLNCSDNNLTKIDVSLNKELVTFVCDSNQLSRLDVSQNTKLETLSCSNNNLRLLDVDANKELKSLLCNDNQLSSLEVTENTKLETLLCQDNDILYELDLREHTDLKKLNCEDNPRLIRLYLKAGREIEDLTKDDITKIKYFGMGELSINIPDAKFKSFLVEEFDTNGDGEISYTEAENVPSIDCSSLGIESLSGIEHFTNLTTLVCEFNELTSLSLSANKKLQILNCSDNEIETLNVEGCTDLSRIVCRRNKIEELNVLKNANLKYLDCHDNKLKTLTTYGNPKIHTLMCFLNPDLSSIFMTSPQMSSVQVSKDATTNIAVVAPDALGRITDIVFREHILKNFDANGDGVVDSTEVDAVTEITCQGLGISSLNGIDIFTNLSILKCSNNNLRTLDVRANTNLTLLICDDNRLTSINVSGCPNLKWLYCPDNNLYSLDVTNNLALTLLRCTGNENLEKIDMKSGVHSSSIVEKDEDTEIVFN